MNPPAGHGHPQTDLKPLGMWVYLMSDCVLFGTLFASYAVLSGAYAGGPTPRELFDLRFVLVETMVLLFSSVSYGYAMQAVYRNDSRTTLRWLSFTFLLGVTFIAMELYEFQHLIAAGAAPQRSAYLSAFFTLVGAHGVHVASGLLWMAVVMHQIKRRGLTPMMRSRLSCLSMFWHFLDLVWICVFTIVYLLGVY